MKENIFNFFTSNKNQNNIVNLTEEDVEANDQTSMINTVKNNLKSTIEVETSYTTFFIFFGIGLLIIGISFLFLPMIFLFPQKFVCLFSIGSIILLFSFIFIYGTSKYIGMLFEGKRKFYTLIYFLSLGVGFYFALFNPYYLACLISSVVQIIMLIIFVLSFIPGGETGISFIIHGIKFFFTGIWKKITG